MKAKIYTKTGDKGQTSLVGGTRVSKADWRLEAYGTLDELNSSLGVLRAQIAAAGKFAVAAQLDRSLQLVQNNLFNIGSHLACEDEKIWPKLPPLKQEHIAALEIEMDGWESELPELKNFILPGGSLPAAQAHVARTICRRAERECVRLAQNANIDDLQMIYLNRLSDWLFLMARAINHHMKMADVLWAK